MFTFGIVLAIIGLLFMGIGHSRERNKQYKWNNYTAKKIKDYDDYFEKWKKERGL